MILPLNALKINALSLIEIKIIDNGRYADFLIQIRG